MLFNEIPTIRIPATVLMVNESGIKVLEFNVRFGDPETEPILMRLETDLYELMDLTVKGELNKAEITWKENSTVGVICASKGYPLKYKKGHVITNIPPDTEDVKIFHAGTVRKGNSILTNGGRVFCVTAEGKNIKDAVNKAYNTVKHISFDGMWYRHDIAWRAISK